MDTREFKVGDKVRKRSGNKFYHTFTYMIVYSVEPDIVWLEDDKCSNSCWFFKENLVHFEEDAQSPKALTGGSTDYYKFPEDATEVQDLIEYRKMNFSIGNIFKACYRLGEKVGTDRQYDLRKIIWFAERELAQEKRGN